MPSEGLADVVKIGQAQAGAVNGPEPKRLPAFGPEAVFKDLDGVIEKVLEKRRSDQLPPLHEGAFGRG